MSAVDTTAQEEVSGPSWDLGQVNIDSLKQILNRFADNFPFIDETQARAFRDQIDILHESGDPHEERITPDERDAEIQRLQEQLATLRAGGQEGTSQVPTVTTPASVQAPVVTPAETVTTPATPESAVVTPGVDTTAPDAPVNPAPGVPAPAPATVEPQP